MLCLGGAPSPPARSRSSERGGSAFGQSSGARGRAPASPSPSGAGEVGAARSQQTPTSRASASVVSPHSSPHVQRREESRETSESRPRVLSSRGSRSSDRGARKDKRARSRTSSSRGRRCSSRSLSSSRSRSRGRERRRRSSSRARSRRDRSRSFDRYRSRRGSSRSRRDRSRSSDRYRSRSDHSRRDRSRSFDRYRSRRQQTRSPACWGDRSDRSRSHALPSRSRDRSRSRGRLPGSSARSRAEEPGRLARRETQEGVEAVASQPPAVSEASVAVTPVAGGAALTALPSAVQDLARFFLSLSESSSLGAIGGIAGVTASAAESGGAVCPPTDAGGATTTCTTAGAGVSPAAPAAVPGVSGEQQRQVESRSCRRRSRSSSDGTDRRAKKRARRRSPSPGPSSRRWGKHYRSSSDSSDEDRADASTPRSGRAHGGAPGGASSSRAYDRSPCPGTSRSQVQVGLPRRITSHPLGSSVSGGSFMVVLGDSKREGVDLSLPVPDLSFYSDASDVGWGAIVGEHQVSGVWTPSQRELSINLREMMAVQKGLFEFGSLLRGKTIALFCDNVTTAAYLGRLEGMRSQVLFLKAREILHEDHASSPVHPGVSQHESGSSQSAQPGDRIGVDTTPGGGPRSSPPVAGDHRPVRDLADTKAPSVLCSSVGTQSSGGRCIPPALGQSSGICFSSHSHHKESSSQTESLSQLRSDSHRPLLASKRMISRARNH